ncbi:uncharacterized protein [Triticum aestivum]|uniref:uncharacterized protein n=1 Tax=Triticum aestivum TaxID=4565 RepID=UPI001D01C930|nr:uncharacterized protein LOC123156911 [Triticum aestivum]
MHGAGAGDPTGVVAGDRGSAALGYYMTTLPLFGLKFGWHECTGGDSRILSPIWSAGYGDCSGDVHGSTGSTMTTLCSSPPLLLAPLCAGQKQDRSSCRGVCTCNKFPSSGTFSKLWGHADGDFATSNWKFKCLRFGQTSAVLKIDVRLFYYRKIVLSTDIDLFRCYFV